MERGLLWLPLLLVFFWLAWSGWNEYQKIESYKRWAEQFERHKYDIYAVLGQKDDRLTWGKPTRKAPLDIQTVTFQDIARIRFRIDSNFFDEKDAEFPLKAQKISLELVLKTGEMPSIRFTDIDIAAAWYRFLSDRLAAASQS
ncbi:hypothetical protein APA_3691 [Pseudanabaena sp. lw0831]|uniref:hypothetical protein n=1 Tax=Pseudanabaena sp. lw0831 TaxID=1357935 RepID=UPI001915F198|nr:hypothetical protein [Pseudanabaena sp. lw0831]GBO55540.1 hypothetical protein APA_3691 [Pseudanabaena sp. lw0831]